MKTHLWASVCVLGLVSASLAHAGETKGADAKDPNTARDDYEVVVTGTRSTAPKQASSGTKSDTPILETPMSIQVIPNRILREQGTVSLDRALNNVSGVNAGGGEGDQESIYLRGFFTTATFRNGFRVDEYSPTGGGTVGSVSLANVEQIEVLKGPAAILYGLVEPGGIVNITTKQPKDYFGGSFEQTLGSWDHSLTSLDITGPLTADKTLLFRLNAAYDQSNSWRQGVDSKNGFVAPVLEWRATPKTTITLEGTFRHDQLHVDVGQVAVYESANNRLIFPPRTAQILSNKATYNIQSGELRLKHQFNDDWMVNLHLVDNEVVVPTGIGYYPDHIYQSGSDWIIARNMSVGGSTNRERAAIVDVTGHFANGSVKHTVLFGGDFYHSNFAFDFGGSDFTGPWSETDFFHPTPVTPLAVAYNFHFTQMNESYGVHLQDQMQVTPKLFVLAGARYQHFRTDGDVHDQALTPRVGVLWKAKDNVSLYANYSENFGVNNGFDYLGKALPPEKARESEVGTKGEWYEGRLTASLAAYDLTKFNVAVGDPAHPGFNKTIGEVSSRGLEFDVQGELGPGLNLIANASYDYAYVLKSTPGSGYVQGHRLDNDPLFLANLWATYRFRFEGLKGWMIGGGANYHGSSVTTQGGIPRLVIPGFTEISAMAAYDFHVGTQPMQLQVNINNLFDTHAYNDLYVVGYANYSFVNYNAPRQVSVALKVAF